MAASCTPVTDYVLIRASSPTASPRTDLHRAAPVDGSDPHSDRRSTMTVTRGIAGEHRRAVVRLSAASLQAALKIDVPQRHFVDDLGCASRFVLMPLHRVPFSNEFAIGQFRGWFSGVHARVTRDTRKGHLPKETPFSGDERAQSTLSSLSRSLSVGPLNRTLTAFW